MMMSRLILATFAATGLTCAAQAAVLYGGEDFEGEAAGTYPTLPNNTEYINTADTSARAQISNNVAGGPTGQHGLLQGNVNKHITQTAAMSLTTDGVQSLVVDFAIRFDKGGYSLAQNVFELVYSAAGDFSDEVVLQQFTTVDSGASQPYEYNQLTWYLGETVTINSTDPGITFTDTAKIRWRKGVGSNGFSSSVYIDDVNITGVVPEPGSFALLGLGTLCVLRRRRG